MGRPRTGGLVIENGGESPNVFELRQYTLRPGRRDDLVTLFDREFAPGQTSLGITVVGQFRDLDHPDRFVWIRAFPDMETRTDMLSSFYGGEIWRARRDEANATMVDSDDVLLLRPIRDGIRGPRWPPPNPRPPGSPSTSLVVADVWLLALSTSSAFHSILSGPVEDALSAAGGPRLALFETEDSVNGFPALPVRHGLHAVVRLARFDNDAAYSDYRAELRRQAGFDLLERRLADHLDAHPQRLHLRPTAGSGLR